MNFMNMLPYDCVCKILSLTSPADACRWLSVSSTIGPVADCDLVWEKFLPFNHKERVSRSLGVDTMEFSSKKELYFRLTDSILIDGGTKSFKLDKLSGKIHYVFSARELSISWCNNPTHWIWKSIPESRFSEVAALRTVFCLEIQAKITTRILSPNTKYGAYLVYKISKTSFGLDSIPVEISLQMGSKITKNTTYLRRRSENNKRLMEHLFYKNRMAMLRSIVDINGEERVSHERKDGWMEIELGEFFSGDRDSEVEMSLKEVNGYQLKGGLIVEGIEFRPKKALIDMK